MIKEGGGKNSYYRWGNSGLNGTRIGLRPALHQYTCIQEQVGEIGATKWEGDTSATSTTRASDDEWAATSERECMINKIAPSFCDDDGGGASGTGGNLKNPKNVSKEGVEGRG